MAQIQAKITKVEHDVGTGWYTILTDHESVKRLTTKMEQKAQEAAGLRQAGDVALIEYSPKQRHDESSGRTYNNNYYERAKKAEAHAASNGAGIETVGGTAASGIEQAAPTGRKTDPLEAWRIALSVGAKLAVETLPLMPVEQRDFDSQKRIAVAWAHVVFTTPPPGEGSSPADMGLGPTTRGPGAYDEPGTGSYDAPPVPGDEDIPF